MRDEVEPLRHRRSSMMKCLDLFNFEYNFKINATLTTNKLNDHHSTASFNEQRSSP